MIIMMMDSPHSSLEQDCAVNAHMSTSSTNQQKYQYNDPNYFKRYINVHIDRVTHARLQKQGTAGDSLCDVIKSMLDEREAKQQTKKMNAENEAAAIPAK